MNRVRARLDADANPVRELLGAGVPAAGAAGMGNARKAKGAKLSFSGVSVRGGTFGPTFYVFMEIWRGLFDRQASSRPQGTGAGLPPSPGKQKLSVGLHPERTACVRGSNADTNTVRVLPTAGAGARRGHAPGISRVRARLSEGTNPVRDLLTAGVPAAGVTAGAGQRRFSHRRRRGSSGRSGGRCGPCTRRGRAPQTGGRDRCPPRAG